MVNTLVKWLSGLFKKKEQSPMRNFVAPQPMDKKTKRFYAEELLGNPLYEEIIKKIESDALELWKNTPHNDVEGREIAYMHFRVLRQIDGYIRRYVSDAAHEELRDRQVHETAV